MSGNNIPWLHQEMDRVYAWCVRKGWEPDKARTFGDDIALLHSEVSEALEAYRMWKLDDATQPDELDSRMPKPEGVGSELADVLVRLLHTCARYGIDLHAEYERKMAYNETRAYRHGGKAL
jgi:NTP pyrophosphatase (non-canonical NTP hydrolase)